MKEPGQEMTAEEHAAFTRSELRAQTELLRSLDVKIGAVVAGFESLGGLAESLGLGG